MKIYKVYVDSNLAHQSYSKDEANKVLVDEFNKAMDFHERKGITFGVSRINATIYTTHRQDYLLKINHQITVSLVEENDVCSTT